MKFPELKNILILGAGTLGLRVGLQSAISGYNVVIYDINEKPFDYAKKTHRKILAGLIKRGKIAEEEAEPILARIKWTTDPHEAVKDADLINESVTEDYDIKIKVWNQFGEISPEKTIFTTNTSYFLPSMFAEASGRPAKFIAWHFHDVFLANVADIMPHPGTDPQIVDLLVELSKKLWQTPVVIHKENPGYLFNYMLMAVLGAAGDLLTREIAHHEDIDRSWMGNFKMNIGPFGMMDAVGLDTVWHVTHNRKDSKSQRMAQMVKKYIDAGKLGVKTGEGFYTYPNPRFKDDDFII